MFDYGNVIYHGMSQADAASLQRLQNSACRAMLRRDMYAPIDEMHEELDISRLYQRRCQHIATQVHKFKHGNGTPDCQQMLIEVNDVYTCTTRSTTSNMLYVTPTWRKLCQKDFAYTGPIIWNKIPLTVRSVESTSEFKTEIKKTQVCVNKMTTDTILDTRTKQHHKNSYMEHTLV